MSQDINPASSIVYKSLDHHVRLNGDFSQFLNFICFVYSHIFRGLELNQLHDVKVKA